jgi:hypothetical protein
MRWLRLLLVSAIVSATAGITSSAQASQPDTLRDGIFEFSPGPSSNPAFGPRISVDIVRWRDGHGVHRGGHQLVSNVSVSCTSSATPPTGIPADHQIVLRIPGNLEIVGHRSFHYAGPATIYPMGSFTATATATTTTQLVLNARFVGVARTRTATYPTGFKGSFSSSACARSTIAFSYHHL